jgi:hypothetical protein
MTMPVDRRRFLVLSGGFVVGVGVAGSSSGCALDLNIPPDASFDEVLDAIHRTDLEFAEGQSNHAPMAAEALVTLGAARRVVSFLHRYQGQLRLLEDKQTENIVGDYETRATWVGVFDTKLNGASAQPFADVVAFEVPALASALFGSGLHAVIRTAHALRSLEREDTPSRRRELAFGLAYWTVRNTLLPGAPGAFPQAGVDVVTALQAVPLIPEEERVTNGLIVDRFDPLSNSTAFIESVERVDFDALPFDESLDELVAAAARMFVHEGSSNIALLHGITGCAAVRLIAPYVDAATQRTLLAYTFQGIAALRSAVSTANGLDPVEAVDADIDDLVARAIAIDDEHAFKLVEAVRREHERSGRPELLAAARLYVG